MIRQPLILSEIDDYNVLAKREPGEQRCNFRQLGVMWFQKEKNIKLLKFAQVTKSEISGPTT